MNHLDRFILGGLLLIAGCGPADVDLASATDVSATEPGSATASTTGDSASAPTTGTDAAPTSTGAGTGADTDTVACGDGSRDDGEACDDGNTEVGDGCDASCQTEPTKLCPPGTENILANAGFEDGVLSPWVSNGPVAAITGNPHSDIWSARVDGNTSLQQDLASAVPVIQLKSATFWSWHDNRDEPAMLIEWLYDDLAVDDLVVGGPLDGWQMHDVLEHLDPNRSLLGFRVWGYSSDLPAPNVSVFDDFGFCATP